MSDTYFPPVKPLLPKQMREFMETEFGSGIVMLLCAGLAMLAANSPWSVEYKAFIDAPIGFSLNKAVTIAPLKEWVKDILMVFFFLVVGLELKREICEGVLSKRGQVLLPLFAAMGGMAVPAAIFFAINYHHPENIAGWAIPSATDIAFALCILTLVSKKIPPAVKIFLLAIAIFDDLGAIVIIAAFYNSALELTPLLYALGGVLALILLNRRSITTLTPYILIGVYLWYCLYHGGIHTTIAGVVVGMAIPMRDKDQPQLSPINRTLYMLHPWVGFLVLPIFAFTSAGVNFSDIRVENLLDPITIGIALGLFFGKPIGIFGVTALLVGLRIVPKPEGASWMHLYGASVIAGIGFTMSLFIGLLAFTDPHIREMVKLGVIGGSLLSSVWGFVVLRMFASQRA